MGDPYDASTAEGAEWAAEKDESTGWGSRQAQRMCTTSSAN